MVYCSATAEIMKAAALDFDFATVSDLRPHFRARIFGVELAELAQKLLGPLVARRGGFDRDFDDLVAALVVAGVEHAFLAKAEALAVLRALRDLEQGAA